MLLDLNSSGAQAGTMSVDSSSSRWESLVPRLRHWWVWDLRSL